MKTDVNTTKIRILSAIQFLTESKQVANSNSISKLSGVDVNTTKVRLRQMRSILNVQYDSKNTDKCNLKYKLNKRGQIRLEKLIDRYEHGYDLRLQKKPIMKDWTGFQLLPGLHILKELENESK